MPILIPLLRRTKASWDDRGGLFGIDSAVRRAYGPVTASVVLLLTGLLFAGVLAGQFLSIAFYLQSFGGVANYVIVLFLGCVGTIVYTVLFGFRSVLMNDIVQDATVLAFSVVLPWSVLLVLAWVGLLAGCFSLFAPVIIYVRSGSSYGRALLNVTFWR
jgi:Na+/proline symporter